MKTSDKVRSLTRGLQILECLNRYNGANLNAVVRATGLNRGTAYRMLETLCEDGFLVKRTDGNGYWLTSRVGALSHGYRQDGWISDLVVPLLEELTDRLKWPCSFLVPAGAQMLSLAQTDHQTTRTFYPVRVGLSVSLLKTASGLVYLAFADPIARQAAMMLARNSQIPQEREDPRNLSAKLRIIRSRGYHIAESRNRIAVVAVPVVAKGHAIGSIAMRYFEGALSRSQAAKTLTPALLEIAERMAQLIRKNG